MSLPDTTVKRFSYFDTGSPTISSAAGGLIPVLDACLVNGYGSVTLDSLSVSDGVATATVSTGHGFTMYGSSSTGAVIAISGATPVALNGEWRIASVTDTTAFTFLVSGVADGAASGTIVAKRAPAGWEKRYADTNRAVYARTALDATAMLLYVDDTPTDYATVRMYESMTDIDTGTNPSPTVYWLKQTPYEQMWEIFCDERIVYFVKDAYGGYSAQYGQTCNVFGDFLSHSPGATTYDCCLCGSVSATHKTNYFYALNDTRAFYVTRGISGSVGSVACSRQSHKISAALGVAGEAYPSPKSGGLTLASVDIWEGTTVCHGRLPGAYNPLHPGSAGHLNKVVEGEIAGTARAFLSRYLDSPSYGVTFDLTGPWR